MLSHWHIYVLDVSPASGGNNLHIWVNLGWIFESRLPYSEIGHEHVDGFVNASKFDWKMDDYHVHFPFKMTMTV